jgi:uncharacterized lipoprotein YmbA
LDAAFGVAWFREHLLDRRWATTSMEKHMRRLTTTLAITACGVAALAGCSSSSKAAAKKDVTITACTASPTGGHPTATGTIVNHSSKASLYTLHVKFNDSAGNGVGDGVAAVAKVQPAATANWHLNGTVNAKGPLTCDLASVTRTLAP